MSPTAQTEAADQGSAQSQPGYGECALASAGAEPSAAWALVPREPTEAMLRAATRANDSYRRAGTIGELAVEQKLANVYRAMLAAAASQVQVGVAPDLLTAARAVSKAQADFKTWAEAGVMRGLLHFTEADLRKASLDAFTALNAAIAKASA